MKVYIIKIDEWYEVYSYESGDMMVRFPTGQDAVNYSNQQGWLVVD